MNLIFSAGENWELGFKNRLVFRAKADMAHFARHTTGKIIVMGRKTLETLPGGKPLKNRTNYILTTDIGLKVKGATVVHSVDELRTSLKEYRDSDVFVIGGESVYRQLLPYCDTAYVTRFLHTAQADRFMPDFDKLEGWRKTESSGIHEENGLRFRFDTYTCFGTFKITGG
jgi:dihydrofolate reductase